MNEIIPNRDGLPPRKASKDKYTAEEKAVLVAKAAELGVHNVADAYGLSWRVVAGWQRFYNNPSSNITNDNPATKQTKQTTLIIQSPSGQEITTEEILAKVGQADKIYIRADENKAYWVRTSQDSQQTGSVELW